MSSPILLLAMALCVPAAAPYAKEAAELDKRLAAMRKAGEPTTLAELARLYREPAPGQNAAPLLTQAFERMGDVPPALAALLPIVGDGQPPEPNEPPPPPMADAIRDYVKGQAPVLKLLHKAAKRKGCKFELNFADGMALQLPHLSKIRQACRVLALEAIDRTERGEADKAADSLLAMLRAAAALKNEPILVSGLVRVACAGIATEQVERWACRARPEPKLLERIEAALQAEADPRLMENAIVGERCLGMDAYRKQIPKPGGQNPAEGLGMDDPKAILRHLMPPEFFKADMLAYVDLMSNYLEAARKPYPQSLMLADKVGKGLEKRIAAEFIMARALLPALGRLFVTAQEHMARLDTARTGLAILRYRARHARFPDKLDALVPDFLDAVPPDPFDGKPLRYKKAPDGGFVVYALGKDRVDNGGVTRKGKDKPPDVGFRYQPPPAQF